MAEIAFFFVVLTFLPLLLGTLGVGVYTVVVAKVRDIYPDYSSITGSLYAALRLQLLFFVSAVVLMLLFNERFRSLGFALLPLLLIFAGVVGVIGLLYCFVRGVPQWLRWQTWRRLIWPPA